MVLFTRLSAMLLLLLASFPLSAQVVMGDNLGPIPDGGLGITTSGGHFGAPRDVTFNVTGRTGTVSSVMVGFDADHTFVGDLRVTLIAPNGVPHILFSRTGATTATGFGAGANLTVGSSYTFDDTATTNWWTHVANNPTNIPGIAARTTIEGGAGVSAPAAVTSLDDAFASTPPNGQWTLRFEDGGGGDTGNVTRGVLLVTTSGGNRSVTTDADSGGGSLRQAIIDAAAGDLITFASPFFDTSRTINLLTALPTLDRGMAIQGPGADLLTVRRADDVGDFAVFTISAGAASVSLSDMRISNGRSADSGGGITSDSPISLSRLSVTGNRASNGGGLFIGSAPATLVDCSISGNRSQFQAGGIFYAANGPFRLRLFGSTVSGNEAGSFPGGVLNAASSGTSTVEIVNSTIAGNRAANFEGGILTQTQGTATTTSVSLRNSIVADNLPNNLFASANVGTATFTSRGFNLSNDYNGVVTLLASDRTGDARLGPLALQGGTVPTRTLLGGSLALDNGNGSAGAPFGGARGELRVFDLAGFTNPVGGNGADIGAVERQAITDANVNGAGLDDVVFAEPFFTDDARVIAINSALPNIASELTVNGTGADLLSVRREAAADFRIFTVNGGLPIAAFSGMTIRDGQAGFGAGIQSSSPLALTQVHIQSNTALPGTTGGGLYLQSGDGRISNSTFSENVAAAGGPGLAFIGSDGRLLSVMNSTFSNNSGNGNGALVNASTSGDSTLEITGCTIADNMGNGIFAITQGTGTSARTLLRNSIVGNNSPQNFALQSGGPGPATIESRGFNLTDTASATFLDQPSDQNSANPGLAPLADNGGATPTRALLLNSDALDGGNGEGGSSQTDQRGMGFARTLDLALPNVIGGDGTDIGAFEAQVAPGPGGDLIFLDGFEASPPP